MEQMPLEQTTSSQEKTKIELTDYIVYTLWTVSLKKLTHLTDSLAKKPITTYRKPQNLTRRCCCGKLDWALCQPEELLEPSVVLVDSGVLAGILGALDFIC